jgi:hypothetical protein
MPRLSMAQVSGNFGLSGGSGLAARSGTQGRSTPGAAVTRSPTKQAKDLPHSIPPKDGDRTTPPDHCVTPTGRYAFLPAGDARQVHCKKELRNRNQGYNPSRAR